MLQLLAGQPRDVNGQEAVFGQEEVILQPREEVLLQVDALEEARWVALFGAFRGYERGRWKVAAGIRPSELTLLHVRIHGSGITIH